jgi:hypothetical protein
MYLHLPDPILPWKKLSTLGLMPGIGNVALE